MRQNMKKLAWLMVLTMVLSLLPILPAKTADAAGTTKPSFNASGALYFVNGRLCTDATGKAQYEYKEGKGKTWDYIDGGLLLKGFRYETTNARAFHILDENCVLEVQKGTVNTISSVAGGDEWSEEQYSMGGVSGAYALVAHNELTICGEGTLNLTAYNSEVIEPGYDGNFGGVALSVVGDLTIDGPNVNAVTLSHSRTNWTYEGEGEDNYGMANSEGVECDRWLTMKSGTLTARGCGNYNGEKKMEQGTTRGIWTYSLHMEGGTINAYGGDYAHYSDGLIAYANLDMKGGTINAYGGIAGESNGVRTFDFGLNMKGGTINAVAQDKGYSSVGMYASAFNVSGNSHLNLTCGVTERDFDALRTYASEDYRWEGIEGTMQQGTLTIGDKVAIVAHGDVDIYGGLEVKDSAYFIMMDGLMTLHDGTLKAATISGGKETVTDGNTKLTQSKADKPVQIGNFSNPFKDVSSSSWKAGAVAYVFGRNIMNGTSKTTFGPDAPLTRGQVATMFWNLEGGPAATTANSFSDVPKTKYYYTAVEWAKSVGVVSGNPDGTFKPGENISRQDLASIIRNYAKYKGCDVSKMDDSYMKCSDYKNVSGYALNAVKWAYTNGLMGSNGKLAPRDMVTRAEAASMLQRFLQNFKL